MKKFTAFLMAALMLAVSCNEEGNQQQQEDPTLKLSQSTLTFESTGGSESVTVQANNPWTAEVSSGSEWITLKTESSSFTVTAAASTSHQARMGSVSVKSGDLREVLSITQTAAPNNDKIEVSPSSVVFESTGGEQKVSVSANVNVTATSSESWLTVSPGSSQAAQAEFTLTAAANTGSEIRNASVTFAGGDAESVTVAVSQNPAAFIRVSETSVSAPAAGTTAKITVTSNVEWTAASSESWVTVSPASGTNAELTITVAANTGAERTATVTLSKGEVSAAVTVSQEGAPYEPGEEKVLAYWRCDDAAYVDSHSPDWSTNEANAYSHGSGQGIALPEEGAPEGTQMTWFYNGKHSHPIVYITAAEGHFAVKAVAEGDGFIFTVPGQNLTKGQIVKMDIALASGAATCPKNWIIKFRTSSEAEWVNGTSDSAFTTDSGATAFWKWDSQKVYSALSRFNASYTIPEAVSNATLQIFVCTADGQTGNGKSTSSGATMRVLPLVNAEGTAEYPGPRITIR